MKKIFFLFAFVFLVVLPYENAFAYSGGLLNTKTITRGSSITNLETTTTKVTDNSTTTSYTMTNINSFGDCLYYHFASPVSLNSFLFDANSSNLNLVLYDSNKNVLHSQLIPNVNNSMSITSFPTVDNVSYVSFENNAAVGLTVYEMDVFYNPPPVSTTNVTGLSATNITSNGLTLNWTNPTDSNFGGTKIYNGMAYLGTVSASSSSFDVSALLPSTSYTFTVKSVNVSDGYNTSGTSFTVSTLSPPPDTTPPQEVANVVFSNLTDDSVDITFDNPTDLDFDKVLVYKDGVLNGQSYNGTYSLTGLTASTLYSLKFVTADLKGNLSTGITKTFTTNVFVDLVAPVKPAGLKVVPSANGGFLTWSANTELDIKGYNVYVDGVKKNTSLLSDNEFSIIGLASDKTYVLKVTAVDSSDNESVYSTSIDLFTDSKIVPSISMKYKLGDVSLGVTRYFSSWWVILAFSVGLSLAFYVASRTKLLFLH